MKYKFEIGDPVVLYVEPDQLPEDLRDLELFNRHKGFKVINRVIHLSHPKVGGEVISPVDSGGFMEKNLYVIKSETGATFEDILEEWLFPVNEAMEKLVQDIDNDGIGAAAQNYEYYREMGIPLDIADALGNIQWMVTEIEQRIEPYLPRITPRISK